jgi:glycosyltransferase involved in cell wall biosynthesis
MKKLAVVDMMFCWPPDGGARVDLKETVTRLARCYDVRLFAPKVDCIISRGEIDGRLPFDVETIPFTPKDFTGPKITARFRSAVDRFAPDAVFLADGFQMKPWAAKAVEKYPYLLKFYAYENVCLRYNGTFMCGDRSCYRSGLSGRWLDRVFCTLCGSKTLFNDYRSGVKGFSKEFVSSQAYSLRHWIRTQNMLNNARHIIVNNHLLKDILTRVGWNSRVVPGGIDTELFPPQPFRKPDGIVRLGLIGRVTDRYKGATPAVRALNLLHRKNIHAELHLTGEPDKKFGKIPGVVFQGWFSQDKLKDFYQDMDICIVPSVWQEPFGIVTLEAMSIGRPVIASNVAGQREIVTDGETGYLVAPNSAVAIADAVVRCVQCPEKTAEMVEKAGKHVREKFTWDTVVEAHYLPLFRSLCESGKQL